MRRNGNQASKHRKIGLTLQELLIAIAVLAILCAIILPMFSRVRGLCYRAQCASNLRQLGGAFALYQQDWDGRWPCPGGLIGNRSYWAQSGNGGLGAYVRQRGLGTVWCCPLLDNWSGKYPARSYSMNSYLRDPADVEYPLCVGVLCGIKVDSIAKMPRTVLLYEGIPRMGPYQNKAYTEDQVYYIYRCANWSWVRGHVDKLTCTIEPGKPWHGRKNNYLYCDGHVVARAPGRKVPHTTLSSYKEMYEWYVDKSHYEEMYQKRWAGLVPRE